MTVVSQDDTRVTLDYTLYQTEDPLMAPTGGAAKVRLRWDGNKLVPLVPFRRTTGKHH
jgi:hypothetical protein